MDFAKNLKLIIFDFDGTLHDFDIDWVTAKRVTQTQTGESLGQAVDRHKARNNNMPLQALTELETKSLAGQKLNGKLAIALNSLSQKYTLAVYSRNSSKAICDFLERSGVNVDMIVGREEVKRLKPDPEGIKLILDRLKCLPSQTLMVGDTWHDEDVARNAGVNFAIVGNKYSNPKKSIAPPDLELKSPVDLVDYLLA